MRRMARACEARSSGSGRRFAAVLASPRDFRDSAASEFSAADHSLPRSRRRRVDCAWSRARSCARETPMPPWQMPVAQFGRIYMRPASQPGHAMATPAIGRGLGGSHRHKFRLRLRASTHIQTATCPRAAPGPGWKRPPAAACHVRSGTIPVLSSGHARRAYLRAANNGLRYGALGSVTSRRARQCGPGLMPR